MILTYFWVNFNFLGPYWAIFGVRVGFKNCLGSTHTVQQLYFLQFLQITLPNPTSVLVVLLSGLWLLLGCDNYGYQVMYPAWNIYQQPWINILHYLISTRILSILIRKILEHSLRVTEPDQWLRSSLDPTRKKKADAFLNFLVVPSCYTICFAKKVSFFGFLTIFSLSFLKNKD